MGQIEQIRRMIILRHYLHTKPRPGTRKIARALGVNQRTLDRDLELLRTADRDVDSVATAVESASRVRLSGLKPEEAAVLLAVCKHERWPHRGSRHRKAWDSVRRRLAGAIETATKNCRGEVQKHLQAILKIAEPMRNGSGARTSRKEFASSTTKKGIKPGIRTKAAGSLSQ